MTMIPNSRWKKIGRTTTMGRNLTGWDPGPCPLTAAQRKCIVQVLNGEIEPHTLTPLELKWLETKVSRLACQRIKWQHTQDGGVLQPQSSSLH